MAGNIGAILQGVAGAIHGGYTGYEDDLARKRQADADARQKDAEQFARLLNTAKLSSLGVIPASEARTAPAQPSAVDMVTQPSVATALATAANVGNATRYRPVGSAGGVAYVQDTTADPMAQERLRQARQSTLDSVNVAHLLAEAAASNALARERETGRPPHSGTMRQAPDGTWYSFDPTTHSGTPLTVDGQPFAGRLPYQRTPSPTAETPVQRALRVASQNSRQALTETNGQIRALDRQARDAIVPSDTAGVGAQRARLQQRADSLRSAYDQQTTDYERIGLNGVTPARSTTAPAASGPRLDAATSARLEADLARAGNDLKTVLDSDAPPAIKAKARQLHSQHVRALMRQYGLDDHAEP